MTRIVAISGSLRKVSLNTALLRAAMQLAPSDVEIRLYEGLGNLPLFNPDLEGREAKNRGIAKPLIQIRKAVLEDAPILVDLTVQLGYQVSLPALTKNIHAYLNDPERSLFVALIERNVVGYIALDMAQTFHREEKHMRVVSLVVDKGYQGKGIGTRLLQTAEEWAKREGCWVIELTSSSRRQQDGTHDFYLNRGYLKDGSQAYFRKLIDGG